MAVKTVLIVGPSIERTKGGMATVIQDMLEHSRHSPYRFRHLVSHAEGSSLEKIGLTLKAVMAVLFGSGYDILHLHVASGASFFRKSLVAWAGKLRGKPLVMHVHGADFDEFYQRSGSLVQAYIRSTFATCNKVLLLSAYWKGFFDEHIHAGNTEILQNGVYAERFRAHHTLPANLNRFLFLGRLGQRKGVYDLLEAIRRLVHEQGHSGLVFYLAGDGELQQVEEIITKQQLQQQVQLLGWLNEQQKLEWFSRVDTMVLPSYNEGLPMAILEAMAAGKIIISSTVGGIPELVKHQENGFLITPGDVEALSNYIRYVVEHPAEMQQMAVRNMQKIDSQYNLAKINARLAEIYAEIQV